MSNLPHKYPYHPGKNIRPMLEANPSKDHKYLFEILLCIDKNNPKVKPNKIKPLQQK